MKNDLKDLISRDFDLEKNTGSNDHDLFEQLCERIEYLMAYEMESFMSMLYRLDISEKKVRKAMAPDASIPANRAIAKLIIARQEERMATKKKYRQAPLKDWMDF